MKRNILFVTASLFATASLIAAPKDDVSTAIKKLADGGNYSWSTTTTNPSAADGGGGGGGGGRGRGGFGGGPSSGKITKEGYALITRAGFQGNTTETIVKGEKSVTKNQDGVWQTPEELAAARGGGGGGGGGGRGFGRGGAAFNRLPTTDAQELLAAVTELKAADGALSGDLSKEAVNARLLPGGGRGFGGGGGEAPPPPANAKGSVKYWLKDGALTKFEFNVQGTMDFGGNEFPINRTTTVEIKDVGTTKVEVPEDAKKKLQ